MAEKIDDGGAAFPRPAGPEPRVNTYHEYQDGMSLRAYFAGQALAGILSKTPLRMNVPREAAEDEIACIARGAVLVADTLLQALREPRDAT